MPFSGNYMCTSFKKELLEGLHDFRTSSSDVFKLALYNNSASFDAATTAYTTSNEVSGTGYTAGGDSLAKQDPTTSATTAYVDFTDLTFSEATITARGALIYNSSASGNPAIVVLDFGGDKASTNGDFTIVFPTASASDAIIRIA